MVSPHNLNFNAAPDATETRTFTIRDTGTGTLHANVGLPKHNPPFSILSDAGALTIAPNTAVTVTVQFAPIKKGTTADKILITSDDSKHKKVTVDLKGKSKAPKIRR